MARPNILWYCTDQQRFDTIGALGNPHVRTSAIDTLVGEGVAFTHAYCQSTICTPSRASFMTGLYPSRVHNTRNGNDTFPPERLGVQMVLRRGRLGAPRTMTIELSQRSRPGEPGRAITKFNELCV